MTLKQRDRGAEKAGLAKIVAAGGSGFKPPEKGYVFVGPDRLVGVDMEYMIGDRTSDFSGEVEVGMVGEVQWGELIGISFGFNRINVVAGDRIDDGDVHRAWIALLAVRAAIGKAHGDRAVCSIHRRGDPDFFVEALEAAVQMVRRIVARELIGFSFKIDAGSCNTARHAPRDGSEVRVACQVRIEIVESENDIGHVAIAIGCEQPGDDAPVRDDFEHEAASSIQRPFLDRLSSRGETEGPWVHRVSHVL